MANSRHPMIKRLLSELRALQIQNDPNFIAEPVGDDLVVWHFSIRGPPDTPFEGGIYHGKIVFPSEYPYKPPDVYFLTPNGRFETNRAICLNTTSYHPESWQPSWGVSSLLTALIAFLPTRSEGIGAMRASDEQRQELALKSRSWRCPLCTLRFPDQVDEDHAEHPESESEPIPEVNERETEEIEAKEIEKIEGRSVTVKRKKGFPIGPIVVDSIILVIFMMLLFLVIENQYPFCDRLFKKFGIVIGASSDRHGL